MLKVKGLSFGFDRELVLCDVDFELRSGQFLSVLGPSGCGKSTLLNCIAGFHALRQGAIEVDGVDVTDLAPEDRNLGVVFQEYALFPHMTVFENIAFGLRARRQTSESIKARVKDLVDVVGLRGMTDRYPGQLSGGQRQRVALARALAPNPRLLLLDEPLTALDRALRVQLQEELRRLHRLLGLTIVLVTHDPEEAMSLSDDILLLHGGRILQSGPARDLYANPVSPDAMGFLGRVTEFSGRLVGVADEEITVEFAESKLRVDVPRKAHWGAVGDVVRLMVRPERVQLRPISSWSALETYHADGTASMKGRIVEIVDKGAVIDVWVTVNESDTILASIGVDRAGMGVGVGDGVLVAIPATMIRCFPGEAGTRSGQVNSLDEGPRSDLGAKRSGETFRSQPLRDLGR